MHNQCNPLELDFRMQPVASASLETKADHQDQLATSSSSSKANAVDVFRCTYCSLQERYDFKGSKPPFARQIVYSEECYVMRDPFSLPNKGEVLILGSDCSICEKSVCLGCSIYFGKRFCSKCAVTNMNILPVQLHPKIKNLIKDNS